MVVVAGTIIWFAGKNDNIERAEGPTVTAPATLPEIPQPLEQVALEEYAIEFEGAPRIAVDVELCNIVKEQCESQKIRDCEDYELCLDGTANKR
jgi:hypothetical protein